MRVLHFYKTYVPERLTGVPRVIWEIAQGAARHGVHTDVLSLSRHPRRGPIEVGDHFAYEAKLDAEIASTGLSVSAFGLFARLAREADVLHYHFPYPFADIVHFATRVKKPVLVTYHSDIVRQSVLLQTYRPLMHAFLSRADHIVATSPNYQGTSPVLQRYAGKTSIIPIALDPGAIPEAGNALLDSWRIRLGGRFFLFVGVLRYYKGLSFLLDAARATGFPVVIVGSGGDESALRAAAADIPNVTFAGRLSELDKTALLTLCTAFAFPSHLRSEAFGIALLEAAMAGKPMISCEIGTGTSYINQNGETGLVVPPADGVAFAEAMRTIWADQAIAGRMGEAARARAARLFSADKMTDAYVSLYETLAERAK
jgi:rhamnosyl/mannosyltransferase